MRPWSYSADAPMDIVYVPTPEEETNMSHSTSESRDLSKQQADDQYGNKKPNLSADQVEQKRVDNQMAVDKQNEADVKNKYAGGSPTPVYKPWATDTTVPPSVASLAERFDALEHHFKAIDDRFVQLERELGLHRAKVVGPLTMDNNHPPLTTDKTGYAAEDSQGRGQGRKA